MQGNGPSLETGVNAGVALEDLKGDALLAYGLGDAKAAHAGPKYEDMRTLSGLLLSHGVCRFEKEGGSTRMVWICGDRTKDFKYLLREFTLLYLPTALAPRRGDMALWIAWTGSPFTRCADPAPHTTIFILPSQLLHSDSFIRLRRRANAESPWS